MIQNVVKLFKKKREKEPFSLALEVLGDKNFIRFSNQLLKIQFASPRISHPVFPFLDHWPLA